MAMPKQSKISIAISIALSCATTWLRMSDFHASWLPWILGMGAVGALGYALIQWWRPWNEERPLPIPESTRPPMQGGGIYFGRGMDSTIKGVHGHGTPVVIEDLTRCEVENVTSRKDKPPDGPTE